MYAAPPGHSPHPSQSFGHPDTQELAQPEGFSYGAPGPAAQPPQPHEQAPLPAQYGGWSEYAYWNGVQSQQPAQQPPPLPPPSAPSENKPPIPVMQPPPGLPPPLPTEPHQVPPAPPPQLQQLQPPSPPPSAPAPPPAPAQQHISQLPASSALYPGNAYCNPAPHQYPSGQYHESQFHMHGNQASQHSAPMMPPADPISNMSYAAYPTHGHAAYAQHSNPMHTPQPGTFAAHYNQYATRHMPHHSLQAYAMPYQAPLDVHGAAASSMPPVQLQPAPHQHAHPIPQQHTQSPSVAAAAAVASAGSVTARKSVIPSWMREALLQRQAEKAKAGNTAVAKQDVLDDDVGHEKDGAAAADTQVVGKRQGSSRWGAGEEEGRKDASSGDDDDDSAPNESSGKITPAVTMQFLKQSLTLMLRNVTEDLFRNVAMKEMAEARATTSNAHSYPGSDHTARAAVADAGDEDEDGEEEEEAGGVGAALGIVGYGGGAGGKNVVHSGSVQPCAAASKVEDRDLSDVAEDRHVGRQNGGWLAAREPAEDPSMEVKEKVGDEAEGGWEEEVMPVQVDASAAQGALISSAAAQAAVEDGQEQDATVQPRGGEDEVAHAAVGSAADLDGSHGTDGAAGGDQSADGSKEQPGGGGDAEGVGQGSPGTVAGEDVKSEHDAKAGGENSSVKEYSDQEQEPHAHKREPDEKEARQERVLGSRKREREGGEREKDKEGESSKRGREREDPRAREREHRREEHSEQERDTKQREKEQSRQDRGSLSQGRWGPAKSRARSRSRSVDTSASPRRRRMAARSPSPNDRVRRAVTPYIQCSLRRGRQRSSSREPRRRVEFAHRQENEGVRRFDHRRSDSRERAYGRDRPGGWAGDRRQSGDMRFERGRGRTRSRSSSPADRRRMYSRR